MLKEVTVIYPEGSQRASSDPLNSINKFRTEDRNMKITVDIKPDSSAIEICKVVFRMMQRFKPHDPINAQLDAFDERSIEVNDEIVIDGNKYWVGPFSIIEKANSRTITSSFERIS